MAKIINVKDIKEKRNIIIGIIVGVVLVVLVSSFRTINSGEVGIKVRFGKVIHTHRNERCNFKIPLLESIVMMKIRV